MSGPHETSRIVAVLGPTNTGKTHYAIERMLAHRDGMIGLPLRLLAREVYDRVVKAKGASSVALVTGEEKIWPDTARYFICTVEAMPLDRIVSFLAIDEIQLARDPDRGHIFTHRLLHARGTGETLLLGSDTMRPMLRRLLPSADIQRRERLSTLSYAGPIKLTRLPKRSAIVAFSAEEVYAIAELIRRHRGGAAVVMGALSPRTRNAQVALYQTGEVDFLVATDAIGMGLNMDVDHVAFASRAKFDGRRSRALRADELAQIAGRAGRFRTDGAFGETGECRELDKETVSRIEEHAFEPVEAIEWRTHVLDFNSTSRLLRSLDAAPPQPGLVRARGSSDEETLKRLADDETLRDRITRPADVRRLWDVCLTPDFRKATLDEHARLVGAMASHLLGPKARISQDWFAKEVEMLDRTDGDLDVLQARLAHIRTWTYVANRPDWIDDCEHWRARARAVEDKLSDTLHELLTQRFIDRRTSALVRGLKREDAMLAGVAENGDVTVEGHYVGRLEGLEFRPDPRADGREAKAVRAAATRALGPEVTRRLRALAADDDTAFRLDEFGRLGWRRAAIGRLVAGAHLLKPRVVFNGGEGADASARDAAEARVQSWISAQIDQALGPLANLELAAREPAIPSAVRGLAFQLIEAGGALDRGEAETVLAGLDETGRRALSALRVRVGRLTVYLPSLLKQEAVRLNTLLRRVQAADGARAYLPRAAAAQVEAGRSWAEYVAAGYRPAGRVALRLAALETFAARAAAARRAAGGRAFALTTDLARILGCRAVDVEPALVALGFKRVAKATEDAPSQWRLPQRRGERVDPAAAMAAPLAALAAHWSGGPT
ncbi:MAG: helicase-related protein [Caulobacterales bacterium]